MTDQNTTPVEISLEEAVKYADFDALSAFVGSLTNPAEAVYASILLAQEHPEEAAFILRTMREEFLATIANDVSEVEKTEAETRQLIERWVEYNTEVHAAPLAGAQRRKRAVDNANKRTRFMRALREAKSPEEAIEAAKAAGIPVEYIDAAEGMAQSLAEQLLGPDHAGHDHEVKFQRPDSDLMN